MADLRSLAARYAFDQNKIRLKLAGSRQVRTSSGAPAARAAKTPGMENVPGSRTLAFAG